MKISLSTSNKLVNDFPKASKEVKKVVTKLVSRELPNCIGAVDECYGAKWIVSQEQLEKIKEIWEKVPKSLKDAIRSFN